MAVKTIVGRLDSMSLAEVEKDGVATWKFWRIVDTEGRDHLLKNVRAREYMTSYAFPDAEGTFAFSPGFSPIFLGLNSDGQVREEYEPWRKQLEGWPRRFLSVVAIDLAFMALIYFKFVENLIVAGPMAVFVCVSPFLLAVSLGRVLDSLLTKLPKRRELQAALETAA